MRKTTPRSDLELKSDELYGSMDELFHHVGLSTQDDEKILNGGRNSSKRNILYVFSSLGVAIGAGFFLVLGLFVPMALTASAAEPLVEWYKQLPTDLPEASIAERSVIYDANNDVITEFWVEDREVLDSLDDVSDYAVDALVATEDRRFFDHGGFDTIGILRSALAGSGGGSGITQQLVKNLQFYDRSATEEERLGAIDVSLERKIQELRYAIAYEEDHSKEDILLEYFNVVSFGGPDIYSIESASQFFFGVPASELDLAQASVLVGSVQNTSLFNLQNPESEEAYKSRQAVVLDSMVATGDITREEASEAFQQELNIENNTRGGGCSTSDEPFFCDYVIDYLRNDPSLGADAEERNAVIAAGGLRINTTLDPRVSESINEITSGSLGDSNRVTLPMAVVEPGTGAVKGFGFNREYGNGEGKTEINLADSSTGTGSAFKMITLGAALNNGFSESSLAFSSPCPWSRSGWDTPSGGISNSTSCALQGGYMNYMQATALSSNTWFVELQSRVGVNNIEEFASRVGLPTPEDQGVGPGSASYTLGPQGHTPIDVAAAYATFAAEGVFCPATPIREIEYFDGTSPRVPDTYNPEEHGCKRALSPQDAGVVLKAMRANMDEDIVPGAFGADAAISGYDAVGKSGTNQLTNQAWGMVSSQYSLYANAYDFATPSRGIDGYFWNGRTRPWNENAAQELGSEVMQSILRGTSNVPLNYDSNDDTMEPVPVSRDGFITVPSVIGMEPESALSVFENSSLSAVVSIEPCSPNSEHSNRFPPGVIVGQSIAPGDLLPRGTLTDVELCVNG